MTKEIKAGDWVRLKEDQDETWVCLDKNKLHKVRDVIVKPDGTYLYFNDDDRGFYPSRFDLIRSAEDGFKIGDVINYSDYEGGPWRDVVINRVGNHKGDMTYGEGIGKEGILGGFNFYDIELVSVKEEATLESSNGSVKIVLDGTNPGIYFTDGELNFPLITKEAESEESHELTAREAMKIADDVIVSLNDVIEVYEALIKNGFLIKKVG